MEDNGHELLSLLLFKPKLRHLINGQGVQNYPDKSLIECHSMNRNFDGRVSFDFKSSRLRWGSCGWQS